MSILQIEEINGWQEFIQAAGFMSGVIVHPKVVTCLEPRLLVLFRIKKWSPTG
jgi:hypothetical protein